MRFDRVPVLEIIVFVCGAAVMVLEVAGVRLLAPHVGTSLYVLTSIIGVVLGALSLGYYVGGRKADKTPKLDYLLFIILLAGIFTALSPSLASVSSFAAYFFGYKLGSVIVALLVFAVPSFLLGFVSPYSVKLKTESLGKLGSVAGDLYALSTLGSIAGTFAAGFVLIPLFGTKTVILATSAALILMSLLCLLSLKKKISLKLFAFLFLVQLTALLTPQTTPVQGETVFAVDSEYYFIQVVDDANKSTRVLLLDNQHAAGKFTNSSDLLFEYIDASRLALLTQKNLSNALMMGFGGGTVSSFIAGSFPQAKIDAVDIDARLFEVARKYFDAIGSAECEQGVCFIAEDARIFLANSNKEYDFIFVDVFNSRYSIPFHLTTLETVREINEHLSPSGVVVVNIISSVEGRKSAFFKAELNTYKQEFPFALALPLKPETPEETQNILLFASQENISKQQLALLARASGDEKLVNYASNILETVNTANAPILTDDYAPVDNLILPLLE